MVVPQAVAVCQADVPFLCDIQRGIALAPEAPYAEVPEFIAHKVDLIPAALDTLRYVDRALLARRITVMPAQRGPDGHDLPDVDGVRRVQRDHRGQRTCRFIRSPATSCRVRTSDASSAACGTSCAEGYARLAGARPPAPCPPCAPRQPRQPQLALWGGPEPGRRPPGKARKRHRWSFDVAGAASMDHRCCFGAGAGANPGRPDGADGMYGADGASGKGGLQAGRKHRRSAAALIAVP